ncbi:MAG: hypothetical protein GTN76_16930, partial [Candidatus Aenigmarchaeota archaeon]|nr:hypothetical protein [Candidatus Aenigmarchaeota archaeon]NIT04620.1 hypothetical protein [Candidatus Saccharibacteria bacterium]
FVFLALIIFVATLSFGLGSFWTRVNYQGKEVAGAPVGKTGGASVAGTSAGSGAEDLLSEITPTGTPDYGGDANISYDKVEESLDVMVGYDEKITLSGAERSRYIKIGTSEDTACEFCCGIGDAGFANEEGQIACGCSHNIAFSGLTKWLIQNGSYSDE